MRNGRIPLVFVASAGLFWAAAANRPVSPSLLVFGIWEVAFLFMGLALGIAATNLWRLHHRLGRPVVQLSVGVTLLVSGVLGVLLLSPDSPARTLAPFAMMLGLAWSMVGLAGSRLSKA